jgi:peptidyl-prolyl cis-trans isomerase C
MCRFLFFLTLSVAPMLAQTAPAGGADPVAVVIDGKPYTVSQLERMAKALPEGATKSFYNDKKAFLEQFALMLKLAELAEKSGVDKESPHAERLAYNRTLYLAQTMFGKQGSLKSVTTDDLQKYYAAHKAELGQAKVKVIYIAFNNNPLPSNDPKAKKPLTDQEAEKKASDLVKQLRGGADFVKLVKEYSDDEDSRSKDGEFPAIKPKDNSVPPAIKAAIFALKPGQVTDPIRQANGFYVFRLDELVAPPFDDVRNEMMEAIQQQRLREWVDSIKKGITIQFKDEQYLQDKAPRNN